jgi:putative GTP pyrophosphokinase
VEVADLITSSRIKFNDAKQNYLRYFQLTSEILARAHEGQTSCCKDTSDQDLVDEFLQSDKRLGLLGTFERLRDTSGRSRSFRKNTLLIFNFLEADASRRLRMITFESVNRAIEEYDRLEKEFGDNADIVLVRGETEESIRDAFRNYFSDARAFVDLVQEGVKSLRGRGLATQ